MIIEQLYKDSISLLKQMIAIPSPSKEEAGVADLINKYLIDKNLNPQRKGNNIWISSCLFDNKKPTILLNSHIDTVKPVNGWTTDPFCALEIDNNIFGLGSNDAGASVVTLLHAFIYLTQKTQPYNLFFLASCEEEISGKNGIECILSELPPIAFAVVGEPTGMNPAIAEKGLMVIDCIEYGQSGHAARDEGKNAIYKAIKWIEWFQNYELPLQSELLGKVKMSVTMVHAGTQHNVIPDKCEFTVDIRTNECYTNLELFSIIEKNCHCDIKARSFRLNSSSIEVEHPFVQRAMQTGKQPFGSPTLSDQALMNFPSIKIGPGESPRSHTANEFIKTTEIREALELYIKLLDNLELNVKIQ